MLYTTQTLIKSHQLALSPAGGALGTMLLPFNFGLGGVIGKNMVWFGLILVWFDFGLV
jgi:NAD dependent epimerase/dehydratase family enzyme